MIHVIAGKQYLEATHVIQVTMITCLFNPFARMFGTILDSIGKTKYNFGVIILFTCVELVLNYFFIRQFHLMGAIYATLLANIIFFVVMQSICGGNSASNGCTRLCMRIAFIPNSMQPM